MKVKKFKPSEKILSFLRTEREKEAEIWLDPNQKSDDKQPYQRFSLPKKDDVEIFLEDEEIEDAKKAFQQVKTYMTQKHGSHLGEDKKKTYKSAFGIEQTGSSIAKIIQAEKDEKEGKIGSKDDIKKKNTHLMKLIQQEYAKEKEIKIGKMMKKFEVEKNQELRKCILLEKECISQIKRELSPDRQQLESSRNRNSMNDFNKSNYCQDQAKKVQFNQSPEQAKKAYFTLDQSLQNNNSIVDEDDCSTGRRDLLIRSSLDIGDSFVRKSVISMVTGKPTKPYLQLESLHRLIFDKRIGNQQRHRERIRSFDMNKLKKMDEFQNYSFSSESNHIAKQHQSFISPIKKTERSEYTSKNKDSQFQISDQINLFERTIRNKDKRVSRGSGGSKILQVKASDKVPPLDFQQSNEIGSITQQQLQQDLPSTFIQSTSQETSHELTIPFKEPQIALSPRKESPFSPLKFKNQKKRFNKSMNHSIQKQENSIDSSSQNFNFSNYLNSISIKDSPFKPEDSNEVIPTKKFSFSPIQVNISPIPIDQQMNQSTIQSEINAKHILPILSVNVKTRNLSSLTSKIKELRNEKNTVDVPWQQMKMLQDHVRSSYDPQMKEDIKLKLISLNRQLKYAQKSHEFFQEEKKAKKGAETIKRTQRQEKKVIEQFEQFTKGRYKMNQEFKDILDTYQRDKIFTTPIREKIILSESKNRYASSVQSSPLRTGEPRVAQSYNSSPLRIIDKKLDELKERQPIFTSQIPLEQDKIKIECKRNKNEIVQSKWFSLKQSRKEAEQERKRIFQESNSNEIIEWYTNMAFRLVQLSKNGDNMNLCEFIMDKIKQRIEDGLMFDKEYLMIILSRIEDLPEYSYNSNSLFVSEQALNLFKCNPKSLKDFTKLQKALKQIKNSSPDISQFDDESPQLSKNISAIR